MILNLYEFSFATKAEDVGMKTGATIHTMNGLNMIVRKSEGIPSTNGWWEKQHLKRGLSATGMPYASQEDAAWVTSQMSSREKPNSTSASPGPNGGCPVPH